MPSIKNQHATIVQTDMYVYIHKRFIHLIREYILRFFFFSFFGWYLFSFGGILAGFMVEFGGLAMVSSGNPDPSMRSCTPCSWDPSHDL